MSPRRAPAHSRQSSTKASRPMSCRVFPVRSLRSRSTTICVAIPAWSTPGTQSTARPCILRQRQSMSSSVRPRACPTCRRPVTFGGGITSEYGTASGPAASGRKNPASSWARYQRISNEAGSKVLSSSGRVFIGERAGSHEGAGQGKRPPTRPCPARRGALSRGARRARARRPRQSCARCARRRARGPAARCGRCRHR